MAKRKRLMTGSLLATRVLPPPAAEATVAGGAPIARVAGETAERAALAEVTRALEEARREGRLIQRVAVDRISADHLVRDRLVLDEEEMAALTGSIRNRGQQVPLEVVDLGDGEFGLISGWRRLEALRRLGLPEALVVIRKPQDSAEAYLAMVEENEIRTPLGFYERARLVVEATRLGIYPDLSRAVAGLFATASASKRSKILSFVVVHEALGRNLGFPAAIPERLGLALSTAIQADEGFARRLRDTLRKAPPNTVETERAALERALRRQNAPAEDATAAEDLAPGVSVAFRKGRLVLKGTGVDAALLQDLRTWMAAR